MNGVIANFRRARHHQTGNQMVIVPEKGTTTESAAKLLGKQVVWTTPAGKDIRGKITGTHGRNGCVKALFESGVPGQAVGTKVKIDA